MSGPKVVRVVTREEVIAICEAHLTDLREAVSRWEKVGKRNDLLTDDEVAKTRTRLKEIEGLLSKDRFLDLQKEVPREVEFLHADIARRIEEAAKKKADLQLRKRRIERMAAQKLDEFKTLSSALPDDLSVKLQQIKAGNLDEKSAENILAQVLAALSQSKPEAGLTDEQRLLADKLRGGVEVTSFASWLDEQPSASEDCARSLDAALAELRMLGGDKAAEALSVRQAGVIGETSEAKQRMMADTLQLEVSAAIQKRRNEIKALAALEEKVVELETLRLPAATGLIAEARDALQREDASKAASLSKRVADVTDAERKGRALAAKRRAILKTLADLGYEAREGMETAWVKDGRLVMRRAANPEMGVEVRGAEQLQFRPVRFGSEANAKDHSKDRDIETVWCSDFDKLHKHVLKEQGELKIERATPVGAIPVLFEVENVVSDQRRTNAAPLKAKER